jgi:hypothetical protein
MARCTATRGRRRRQCSEQRDRICQFARNWGGGCSRTTTNCTAASIGSKWHLVNGGTVYDYSVLVGSDDIVNGGTFYCYWVISGRRCYEYRGPARLYPFFSFGGLASSGTLNIWDSLTISNAVTLSGGTVYLARATGLADYSPRVVGSDVVTFNAITTTVAEISGKLSGPGGIARTGRGGVI